MDENKQAICSKLGELLKLARAGADIERIAYNEEKDCAVVYYQSTSPYGLRVFVNGDSGIAMIQDIIRQVV